MGAVPWVEWGWHIAHVFEIMADAVKENDPPALTMAAAHGPMSRLTYSNLESMWCVVAQQGLYWVNPSPKLSIQGQNIESAFEYAFIVLGNFWLLQEARTHYMELVFKSGCTCHLTWDANIPSPIICRSPRILNLLFV